MGFFVIKKSFIFIILYFNNNTSQIYEYLFFNGSFSD